VSRHYRAFDFVVSAAGYNAFHELIRFAVPALFVPMRRELDDQAARARHAEHAGLALACEGPGSDRLESLLDEMLEPGRRERMAARARNLAIANGAEEAARLLSRLASGDRSALAGLPGPNGSRIAMWSTMARARASALVRHPFERRRDRTTSR
jgi:UDP-N-acetylglucosamine:LPS N-acetylglucosamine transferase